MLCHKVFCYICYLVPPTLCSLLHLLLCSSNAVQFVPPTPKFFLFELRFFCSTINPVRCCTIFLFANAQLHCFVCFSSIIFTNAQFTNTQFTITNVNRNNITCFVAFILTSYQRCSINNSSSLPRFCSSNLSCPHLMSDGKAKPRKISSAEELATIANQLSVWLSLGIIHQAPQPSFNNQRPQLKRKNLGQH